MKELNNKINQTMKKSIALQGLALEKLPYDKSISIKEQQDEMYRQYKFFKNLKKAVEKGNKK